MDLTTAILDSVPVGVIVLDRNDVVHVWNEFMACTARSARETRSARMCSMSSPAYLPLVAIDILGMDTVEMTNSFG